MTQIINGTALAEKLRAELTVQIKELSYTPQLRTILVGNDPASLIYVTNKVKAAAKVGINAELLHFDESLTEEALLSEIDKLNKDSNIDGILVQLPLPKQIDRRKVFELIDPAKDVDGFTPVNRGKLVIGEDTMVACTPLGCIELIKQVTTELKGLHAVVIGRSEIVGKPMAHLLLEHNCTVTTVHSHTQNIKEITQQADILISAAGRPLMIKEDWIKKGAILIDVGITRQKNSPTKPSLVGDVDFQNVLEKAKAITPVPGGVGPMTITFLLKNTLKAAESRRK